MMIGMGICFFIKDARYQYINAGVINCVALLAVCVPFRECCLLMRTLWYCISLFSFCGQIYFVSYRLAIYLGFAVSLSAAGI